MYFWLDFGVIFFRQIQRLKHVFHDAGIHFQSALLHMFPCLELMIWRSDAKADSALSVIKRS
jgi:ABC-type uncharacterized transport system permease subunit